MMSLYIFCIPNPVSALNWHSWYQSGPEIMGSKTALWGLGHKLPVWSYPCRQAIHTQLLARDCLVIKFRWNGILMGRNAVTGE